MLTLTEPTGNVYSVLLSTYSSSSLHSCIILQVFIVINFSPDYEIRKGYSVVVNKPPNLSGLIQKKFIFPHSLMEVERAFSIL